MESDPFYEGYSVPRFIYLYHRSHWNASTRFMSSRTIGRRYMI